jgi:TIR domain
MSYLPQFETDLLISYSHMENVPLRDGERGWVSNFHRALEIRLRQLLGADVQIFRDPKLSGNDSFGSRSFAAPDSPPLLVCVLSPRYLRNEWCRRELEEFIKCHVGTDSTTRIFKVLMGPIQSGLQPPELEQQPGYEFFRQDPETGRIRQFDEVFGREAQRDFWMRLDELAQDIAKALEELRENSAVKNVALPVAHGADAFKVVEPDGKYRALRVFLCHASHDKPKVRDLYRLLVGMGVDAWLDEEKLIPGQLWESEIRKALRKSDAVVVCLSSTAITKTGYIQKEIRQVLEIADEYPDEAIFLIPARFDDCTLPERFSKKQWVNLFEERGKGLLIRALERRASQLIIETS